MTLTASSLPRTGELSGAVTRPRRRPGALLLLPLLALVLAVTAGQPPPPPVAAPVLDAELLLLGERLSSSQTGVLVLPVELRNRGGALQVQRIQPYGYPLRADPEVQAPPDVPAGERRRFVLLVSPDCGWLDKGSSELFQVSLLVRVASGASTQDLLLHLSDSVLVRERVAGLCA